MALLTKDQILAVADIEYRTVAVPEWGGEVRIRSMTGADRDAHEMWLTSRPETEKGFQLNKYSPCYLLMKKSTQ